MQLVFLFCLDLIFYACKIFIRCDSFEILNFASKQEASLVCFFKKRKNKSRFPHGKSAGLPSLPTALVRTVVPRALDHAAAAQHLPSRSTSLARPMGRPRVSDGKTPPFTVSDAAAVGLARRCT